MTNFYEREPKAIQNNQNTEFVEKPSKPVYQNYEIEDPKIYRRNEKGAIEPMKIETRKPEYQKEKPTEIDYNYDSFNDRDNRFKLNDFSVGHPAGVDLGRIESGKKLFVEKYRNSNILSWDGRENDLNRTFSNDNSNSFHHKKILGFRGTFGEE